MGIHRKVLALSVAIVVIGFAAAFCGSYWLSLNAIANSNHQWCTSLELITRSNIQNKDFLNALLTLEQRYNC